MTSTVPRCLAGCSRPGRLLDVQAGGREDADGHRHRQRRRRHPRHPSGELTGTQPMGRGVLLRVFQEFNLGIYCCRSTKICCHGLILFPGRKKKSNLWKIFLTKIICITRCQVLAPPPDAAFFSSLQTCRSSISAFNKIFFIWKVPSSFLRNDLIFFPPVLIKKHFQSSINNPVPAIIAFY